MTEEVVNDEHELPAGHSLEQQEAEGLMLAALGQEIGVVLRPTRVHLPDGSYVEVDGANEVVDVFAECWAHQGPPKAAQRAKVGLDVLRLTVVGQSRTNAKLFLVFCDDKAAAPFQSKGWIAEAARSAGIKVVIVALPEEVRERLRKAQERQYR